MKIRFLFAILVSSLWLAQCKVTQHQSTRDTLDGVQSYLDSMLVDIQAPGLSVAITNGKGSYTFASGMADKEENVQMHPDHVLMNGSIGKTYVAAIVLKLVEAGKLNLSDQMSKHLQHYQDLQRIPNAEWITIDHLMTHTSGIPRWIMDPAIWSFVKDDPLKSWTPEERLAYILDADPVHPAGEGWGYSDTNYILLGMIIEKVTGQSYSSVVKSEIIEPQGLEETYVNDQPEIPRLSAAYSGLSQLFQVEPKVAELGRYSFNPQIEWTGGGISTTPRDLASWTYKLHSGKVLSDRMYQIMVTSSEIKEQFPDGSKYGHGCILWNREGESFYGHSGIMPGFLSLTEYSTEEDYAIAIQVNTDRLARGKSLSSIAMGLHIILKK